DTSPVPERQRLAARPGPGSLQAYFLSSLIARSHGDGGVRADRNAAGTGGAHPLPRAAPCAARPLDRGVRSAAARTGSGGVAAPGRGNRRCGATARGGRPPAAADAARGAAPPPPP